jgi:hypothetical protein
MSLRWFYFFYSKKIKKMKKQSSVSMAIVNANAAGIDVGFLQHYVAIGQNSENVKTVNVYTKDQEAMIKWLYQKEIVTVALESTGTKVQRCKLLKFDCPAPLDSIFCCAFVLLLTRFVNYSFLLNPVKFLY